jgi:phosphatidylglycerol lysyltransferase
MNSQMLNNSIKNPEINQRIKDIKKFGTNSMSYSALQKGIKEFRHPSFEGFIPYSTVWGVDYVLSDPITPKSEMLKATVLFQEKHKHAVYCQISSDYARLLSYLKYTINGFGVEHIVNLREFKVSWKKRKCLKSYLSKLNKQNYFVFEYNADSEKVWEINNQWLKGKQGSKELTFLARPFTSTKEEGVRYFYMIKNKEIIGFCTFDPIFSEMNTGEVVSYTLQHLRVSDKAPLGSQDFLILNALFQFKEEGFENISLGLAPLYKRKNEEFKYSKFAEKIFQMIYRTNLFYNYRTIGEHKDHYKADRIQTYLAVNNRFTLKQLCGLIRVNNLI